MEQSIYDFKLKSISGKEINLADYKGKKLMVVNTASKCGFTPQLEALEQMHKTYGDKLAIIGVPSNDFANQDPASEKEISEFCQVNYGVSFVMTEKMHVKGAGKHPFYQWLTSKKLNGKASVPVFWNFQKFLIDENGKFMDWFMSFTKPNDPKIINKINK